MAGTARFTELAVNVVRNEVLVVTMMVARLREFCVDSLFVFVMIFPVSNPRRSRGRANRENAFVDWRVSHYKPRQAVISSVFR
jgi:hypothetical protein